MKQLTDGADKKAELAARARAIPDVLTPEALAALWNCLAEAVDLHRCLQLNPARRQAASARLKEHAEKAYWIGVLRKIGFSPFCRGHNDREWVGNFDWFVRPRTHLRVLEGFYDTPSNGSWDLMRKYWGK
mgnify:CR=1 FL=1